jgi:hypothetical protein
VKRHTFLTQPYMFRSGLLHAPVGLLPEKESRCSLDRRLDVPQCPSGRFGEAKNFSPIGSRAPISSRLACSPLHNLLRFTLFLRTSIHGITTIYNYVRPELFDGNDLARQVPLPIRCCRVVADQLLTKKAT